MPETRSAPLRLLYLEDDPALRGILSTILGTRRDISVVAAVGTAAEAMTVAGDEQLDVALIDLSLGRDEPTGIDVGIELRRLQPGVGIVLLSQHQLPSFLTRLDPAQRSGWSYILKRADLQPQYLADVLHASARGLNVVDPQMVQQHPGDAHVMEQLSTRQRDVMAMAARGLDAPTIAQHLEVSAAAVRQDLSRAYQVLVPDPPAGADLRTLAVLRYLRETRSFTEGADA